MSYQSQQVANVLKAAVPKENAMNLPENAIATTSTLAPAVGTLLVMEDVMARAHVI